MLVGDCVPVSLASLMGKSVLAEGGVTIHSKDLKNAVKSNLARPRSHFKRWNFSKRYHQISCVELHAIRPDNESWLMQAKCVSVQLFCVGDAEQLERQLDCVSPGNVNFNWVDISLSVSASSIIFERYGMTLREDKVSQHQQYRVQIAIHWYCCSHFVQQRWPNDYSNIWQYQWMAYW